MDQNKQSLPRDLLFAILGAAIAAANINTFVYSGNLVPGGFSGLSLLIVRVCAKYFSLDVNYSLLYLLFNIPSALLVFKCVSKRFTLISLVTAMLPPIFRCFDHLGTVPK